MRLDGWMLAASAWVALVAIWLFVMPSNGDRRARIVRAFTALNTCIQTKVLNTKVLR